MPNSIFLNEINITKSPSFIFNIMRSPWDSLNWQPAESQIFPETLLINKNHLTLLRQIANIYSVSEKCEINDILFKKAKYSNL